MIWQIPQSETPPLDHTAQRHRAMRLRARLRRRQLEAALAGQLDQSHCCAVRVRRIDSHLAPMQGA